MSVDKILRRTLEDILREFTQRNPDGGTVLLLGNSTRNQTVIDTAKDLPNVEDAYEVQHPERYGKDVAIEVGATPKIELSYDGEITWQKV